MPRLPALQNGGGGQGPDQVGCALDPAGKEEMERVSFWLPACSLSSQTTSWPPTPGPPPSPQAPCTAFSLPVRLQTLFPAFLPLCDASHCGQGFLSAGFSACSLERLLAHLPSLSSPPLASELTCPQCVLGRDAGGGLAGCTKAERLTVFSLVFCLARPSSAAQPARGES